MNAPANGRQRGSKPRKAKPGRQITAKKTATTEYPSSPYPPVLKDQYALFVDLYCTTFNGTQSAIGAGFSENGASVQAHRMLNNAMIRAEITRRRWHLSQDLQNITRERFEREIATAAFANMADFAPMFGEGTPAEKLALLTRDQAAAVAEITVEEFRDGRTTARQVRRTKFKLVPKNASLELYGKARGFVTEKVDHKHDHQHLILAALLAEIADEEDGKPIVDTAIQDQRPEGEAA